jgi:hypothetical protein
MSSKGHVFVADLDNAQRKIECKPGRAMDDEGFCPTGSSRMLDMRRLLVVPICRNGCILNYRKYLDADPKSGALSAPSRARKSNCAER